MMRVAAWVGSLALALGCNTPAMAQEVSRCDWRASADAIPEPWEAHTRTFSNGKTRLALLDVIEPAAGAYHLLILSPPEDELGARQCRVVGLDGGTGFAAVGFDVLEASYDPAIGLIFDVPVSVFDPATGGFVDRGLRVTLNQATGDISAGLR